MKRASVTGDEGVSKATAVGPLVSVQPMVSVRPGGRPGSVTEPTRVTVSCGRVMVWMGPGSTTGPVGVGAAGVTVTVTLAEAVSAPLVARTLTGTEPGCEKTATVSEAAGSLKLAPGL